MYAGTIVTITQCKQILVAEASTVENDATTVPSGTLKELF
jgi:hypothetical protein